MLPPCGYFIASGWQEDRALPGLDVTAAFLHADLPKERMLIVAPPAALVTLGVVDPDECWVVERALYGLKESRIIGRSSGIKPLGAYA